MREPELADRSLFKVIEGPGSMAQHVNLKDTILHARTFGGTAEAHPSSTVPITADTVALSDEVILYTTSNGASRRRASTCM